MRMDRLSGRATRGVRQWLSRAVAGVVYGSRYLLGSRKVRAGFFFYFDRFYPSLVFPYAADCAFLWVSAFCRFVLWVVRYVCRLFRRLSLSSQGGTGGLTGQRTFRRYYRRFLICDS